MPIFSAAATALHEALLRRPALASCLQGRFDISEPNALLSLSGQKPDGKTVFFWEFDCAFQKLVAAYLAEIGDSQAAQLTILIDVDQETFQPSCTTRQQVAATQKADEKRTIENRRNAPRNQMPWPSR